MSAWVTISEGELVGRFSAGEWRNLTEAARGQGAEDVVQGVISRVVDRVRGYVRTCERNTLGPVGTVPVELRSQALALMVEELVTSLGMGSLLLDERRQEQVREALRDLRSVARCELRVGAAGETGGPVADRGGWGGDKLVEFGR